MSAQSVLAPPEEQHFETYAHTPDERRFVSDWWNEFLLMWQTKTAPQDILGGRNLQQFFDDCVRDYAVLTGEVEDPNDPVQQYVSSISRDKADIFIGNMVSQLLYPSVKAVNGDSKTDKVLSRASRSLLEWAHMNDGYPSETGMSKNVRYVHKMVVEGTVHIQDDVAKNVGLTSSLVPNEEIFIPNFWEPDLQRQSHLVRAQLNVTWEAAEREYGHLDNFKYVAPQFTDFWFIQRPEYKQIFQGVVRNRRVQVMHVWKALTHTQIQKEIYAGRLPRKTKRAKYYNIIINDIPMYPVDNLSPYKDGLFPISKGIFACHAQPEYYWGNSVPNKVRQEKKWMDAWKTLLRYKGKLNLLPPMVSLNGNFLDEDILLPAKITPITEELQLKRIEGVADPISQADVMLLDMAKGEVDSGSITPQMAGQLSTKRMTKAETMVSDNNAKQLMNAFTLNLLFLAHARAFPILRRLYQFLPRSTVETITVSDQKLSDGLRGDLEIVFKKIPKMDEQTASTVSEKILQQEILSRKKKEPRDLVFIDPGYLEDINLFLYPDADSALDDADAIKRNEFKGMMQLLLGRPDLWNQQEVARTFNRMNDLPDEMLADAQQEPVQLSPKQQLSEFSAIPVSATKPNEIAGMFQGGFNAPGVEGPQQ